MQQLAHSYRCSFDVQLCRSANARRSKPNRFRSLGTIRYERLFGPGDANGCHIACVGVLVLSNLGLCLKLCCPRLMMREKLTLGSLMSYGPVETSGSGAINGFDRPTIIRLSRKFHGRTLSAKVCTPLSRKNLCVSGLAPLFTKWRMCMISFPLVNFMGLPTLPSRLWKD